VTAEATSTDASTFEAARAFGSKAILAVQRRKTPVNDAPLIVTRNVSREAAGSSRQLLTAAAAGSAHIVSSMAANRKRVFEIFS
jgi:hypothetical protein